MFILDKRVGGGDTSVIGRVFGDAVRVQGNYEYAFMGEEGRRETESIIKVFLYSDWSLNIWGKIYVVMISGSF